MSPRALLRARATSRGRPGRASVRQRRGLLHVLAPLALALSLVGSSRAARAELPRREQPPAPEAESPLLVRLAPTAAERDRARATALEQRLARLLSALPGVTRAEVSVELPVSSVEPLDQQARSPRVTVVVAVARSAEPMHSAIERIVSGVLPEFRQSDLTVVEGVVTPNRTQPDGAASAHPLVQIGPFLVHPKSATRLRAGLTVLLATNALLAAILLWRIRLSRTRNAPRTES